VRFGPDRAVIFGFRGCPAPPAILDTVQQTWTIAPYIGISSERCGGGIHTIMADKRESIARWRTPTLKATRGRLPTKPATLILQTIREAERSVMLRFSRSCTCVACDKITANRLCPLRSRVSLSLSLSLCLSLFLCPFLYSCSPVEASENTARKSKDIEGLAGYSSSLRISGNQASREKNNHAR